MRTTLKRGVGRGAGLNGKNGHRVMPPAAATGVVRYGPRIRKRRGLVSRILVGMLLTIVAITVGVAGGVLLFAHESLSDVRAHSLDVKLSEKELNYTAPGHAAIALVVGYDQRAGAEFSTVSRSDTVMMIRADPLTKTISLLSIPRDLGVPIWCPKDKTGPIDPHNRVNQAYADCGARGTVDTVKHFTGLPINYLITVNFHGFKEIVDKLGGIWLNIDRRYYHVNNGTAAQNYANINIMPGYQLLSGQQALDFVRYRHTDDDYHRIARQQEFVRALKQQLSHVSFLKIPSLISTLTHNVEVGGSSSDLSDQTVLRWMIFALTLPGGHFFQDKINGVTGSSITYTDPSNVTQAIYQFTHPDVAESKAANAAALGTKLKPKLTAPATSKTSVLVLNGSGIGGAAAAGTSLLAGKGYVVVLPPGNALPNAPTQGYFHTQVYYDKRQPGSEAAAKALAKLVLPADVGPLPKDPGLRRLDPGAMVVVLLGTTFHDQLVAAPPPTPVLAHTAPSVTFDSSTGRSLLEPFVRRAGFPLEVPTVLAAGSQPDTCCGDQAARLYWIDPGQKKKAIRLVFATPLNGDYWGIEETDMPNPPILADKSFQRRLNGREYSLYYSGSSLQMVVLRVHDRSYWVVNTLLDTLSNETMLAIAKGLVPLTPTK